MDLREVKLGKCPECGGAVFFENIVGTAVLPRGRAFRAACPDDECGAVVRFDYSTDALKRIRRLLREDVEGVVSQPVERARLEAELIGRLVQGFRIDLDRVDSLADVLPDWEYENTYAIDRVPREYAESYAELPIIAGDRGEV